MVFTKENPPSGYYVYAYIRSIDSNTSNAGTPYYIGMGKNKRAWNNHKHIKVPDDINKIIILEHNLTNLGAFAIERRMIAWYGRKDNNTGILLNRNDGGSGGSTGGIVSEETRKKLSAALKGRKITEEERKKRSISRKGKKKSKEWVEKVAAANRGKVRSEEVKLRQSVLQKGRPGTPHTEETKRKMSEQRKGNQYHKGYAHSQETREKMREAWKKRKENIS